jgi:rhamnosyl/mannosyltransferase
VGRIVQHKGVDYLVDSAEKMDDDVRYIIVGEGEYLNKLKRRVADKRLQNRVILTGNVSYSDLPKYYAACDVFVLPSISRLEAFGLVVLEAMASGKPVIVSTIPGVSELVTEGENGLHAEPMNSQDLAEKILTLLSDSDLRKRMGESGRRKIESDFNWDIVAHQIEDVYSDLVKY